MESKRRAERRGVLVLKPVVFHLAGEFEIGGYSMVWAN